MEKKAILPQVGIGDPATWGASYAGGKIRLAEFSSQRGADGATAVMLESCGLGDVSGGHYSYGISLAGQ